MNDFNNYELLFGLSYLLTIFITYVFQYWRIIKRKNVDGISNSYLMLGNICSLSSLINSLIFYFYVIKECQSFFSLTCINKMIGFYQISSQFICFIIFYILFIIYYKIADKDNFFKTYKIQLLFLLNQLLNLLFIGITIGILSINNWNSYKYDEIIIYARVMGYISMIFVLLQYLPQIYKLYKTQSHGSLSPITLIFLALGNFISFLYLILEGVSDYTTWLSYLMCFICICIVLIQIFIYKYCSNKHLYINVDDDLEYQSIN